MDATQIFSGIAILVSLITAIGVWRKSGADTASILDKMRQELAKDLQAAYDKIDSQRVEILALRTQVDILLASDKQKKGRIEILEVGYNTVVAKNNRLEKYVKLLIEEIQRCGGTVPELPPLEIENNGGKEMKP